MGGKGRGPRKDAVGARFAEAENAAGQGDLADEVQPELYFGHRGGAAPAELLSAAGVPEPDGEIVAEQPAQRGQGHRVGADGTGEADEGERGHGAGGTG